MRNASAFSVCGVLTMVTARSARGPLVSCPTHRAAGVENQKHAFPIALTDCSSGLRRRRSHGRHSSVVWAREPTRDMAGWAVYRSVCRIGATRTSHDQLSMSSPSVQRCLVEVRIAMWFSVAWRCAPSILTVFSLVESRHGCADAISRCAFDHGAGFGCDGRPPVAPHPSPQ
jgi:hypothetical protein